MPQPPAKDPFAFNRAKIQRGQTAKMSPILKIVLYVSGGIVMTCAGVFGVHAPDRRKFPPSAKDGLADRAWAAAQHVVRSNLKEPPPRLAIGTRGVLLYGHALIGTVQPDEEEDEAGVEVRQSGDHPEYLLYQFFSPQAVPE